MSTYLDENGLEYLWGKIKAYANDASSAIPFGTVDAGSTATVITATVRGVTSLKNGVVAYIQNGVVTSASGWTLNVNNLGAKPVYSTLSASGRITTTFNINYTMMFVYNESRVTGGCWDMFYGYDSNTNTIGYQIRSGSYSLPVSSKTYRYRLLFQSPDATKFVPSNTSTSTDATTARQVNQEAINPFGQIVYYSGTSAVDADSRPGASSLWTQYTLTLGYAFNVSGGELSLIPFAPVYVKCVPQTNGSAIIDANNPIVQSLPSVEDGMIYIYLGVAYSATQIELLHHHPIYYYKGSAIRIWTNAIANSPVVEPSNTNPSMDGVASAGQSEKFARGDHVHPSDTSKVDKSELENAGITDITYTTVLDTTTVTTTTGTVHPKPYAFLTSSPSTIREGLTYRITVDGVEYTLQARGWFVRWYDDSVVSSFIFTIAGNITYFETDPMFYDEVDDVPFLITTLIQPSSTSQESNGLYIFTQTEKSVSVKIELATFQGKTLPNYLIRGETAKAVDKLYSNHYVYRRYNVGYNKGGSNGSFVIGNANKANNYSYIIGAGNITSANNTAAVGTNNEVSATWAYAFGAGNIASGQYSTAIGYGNQSTGTGSVAIGRSTTASGNGSFACGRDTQALGNYSTALGRYGIANGYYSSVNGYKTLSMHRAQFVFGEFNAPDTGAGSASERGNYVEIVGNGTADDARSNARMLDWDGNEYLAGGLTLGMGTANQTSITAQQLNALLSLASSVPNAASIDANGLITFKNGSTSLFTLQLPVYDGSHHSA